jgi:hypothetical protein
MENVPMLNSSAKSNAGELFLARVLARLGGRKIEFGLPFRLPKSLSK